MKTLKISVIIVFFLFDSLLMADEWTIVGQLNLGRRENFQSVLLPDSQSVLITGGLSLGSTEPTSSCEIFDFETGQAVFTDSLPVPLYQHYLIELDLAGDKEYLTIGGMASGPRPPTRRCFRYSSTTNTWQETGQLNSPHYSHAAIAFQDTDSTTKVLVVGGFSAGGSRKICEIYDPQTEIWELTNELNEGRTEHTLVYFPSHQKILVVGDDNSNTAELFDIPSRTWTLTTPIPVPCPQYENGASQLIIENGQEKGLIMAGTSGGNHWLTTCLIFDPIAETWIETDSLSRGGVAMPSAKLPNGDIIVSGGYRTDTTLLSPVTEIYNVEQGEWQRVADMNYPRSHHNLVTLADGRVAAIGSFGTTGSYTVELYSWNDSPEIQLIQGQNTGLVGDTLEFVIQVSDPNQDSVSIRIDWADGDTTDWQEYDVSGTEFCFSKVFAEAGEYKIKVQAKDIWSEQGIHNSLSNWQKLLRVVINPVGVGIDEKIPLTFNLFQNYPNPFNSSTCISYQIPQDCQVRLSIFNLLGQEVDVLVNEFQRANEYVVNWQPKNLPSGIYIYQLSIESENFKRTLKKKLIMME
ncbi:MAG TPA: T9SS type A sorting domain-containing protein [Candidatus Marinimicrobia bacterium]|nr:T9SS type A sorting domain-containing protein [Candidatus Neomarinimicrobiota bacterium]HQH55083.1 T9SS type A sorting domain-containing protein [Candidatus Neomarinimicrobiota bacterium]HQK10765.1 T9SS type A sorting domain-containing protein [Candidatus Neomarinimicrobiota bacterium]